MGLAVLDFCDPTHNTYCLTIELLAFVWTFLFGLHALYRVVALVEFPADPPNSAYSADGVKQCRVILGYYIIGVQWSSFRVGNYWR